MELWTIHLYTAVFKRHVKAYHFGLKSNINQKPFWRSAKWSEVNWNFGRQAGRSLAIIVTINQTKVLISLQSTTYLDVLTLKKGNKNETGFHN